MRIDKTLKGVCLVVGGVLLTTPTFASSYMLANTNRQGIDGLPRIGSLSGEMYARAVLVAEEGVEPTIPEKGVAEAAALRELAGVYGDVDGSIEALAVKVEQVTEETAEELFAQVAAKKTEVLAAYDDASKKLAKLITRSQDYYAKWQDRAGMDELKLACDAAELVLYENSQEQKKNIQALLEAYDSLYKVYEEKGGNSDPAQYVEDLKEQIAEAEQCQQKYNYLSLGQVIKEAKSYQNSTQTNELQNQIRALKAEMERTKEQYKSLVNRMDKAYDEVQAVLQKRYQDSVPEKYSVIMHQNHAALQPAEVQADGIERQCTDMELMQQNLDILKNLKNTVEAAWNQAVENLKKAVGDAVYKLDQTYPGNKELSEAVQQAEQKLKDIEALNSAYDTIAAVENVQNDLDNVLMKIEANDRRNMANNYILVYRELEKNFKIYGSDENSVPTSNVKVFLEQNKNLYEELGQPGLVHYTLDELNAYYKEVLKVKDAYQLFCNAGKQLDDEVAEGKQVNKKYYDNAQGTGLDKALKNAVKARTQSLNIDSVLTYTYALQDSVLVTERIYKERFLELQNARMESLKNHNKYYGSATENSEILDVYREAVSFIGNKEENLAPTNTNIFSMVEMIGKLNNCYKHAEDSCAVLSEELQVIINQVDTLNVLMEDEVIAHALAKAVNAQYAPDARIQAISVEKGSLAVTLQEQTDRYLAAVEDLKKSISRANAVYENTRNEALSALAEKTALLLEKVNPQKSSSSKYKVLVSENKALTELTDTIDSEWKQLLSEALNDLQDARKTALSMHNLYYGSATQESEIMDVYNKSAQYLESVDIEAIQKMTGELRNSYQSASVKYSRNEADLKDLIMRTTPLVTLMEDQTIADQISKAETALTVKDASIMALENGLKELQPVYDTNAAAYDKAVVSLGDTIQVSKDLLMQVRDDELKEAIAVAEQAFVAADKTSGTATLYAELNLQVEKLAVENARVRNIIITGIEAVDAEEPEVMIYTLQGVPMKKVRLSDKDALKELPAGIYIANGKKITID